jgi:hypothetical protein
VETQEAMSTQGSLQKAGSALGPGAGPLVLGQDPDCHFLLMARDVPAGKGRHSCHFAEIKQAS